MNSCQTVPTLHAQSAHLPKRVLCVDESSDILEICSAFLHSAGYQVGTFKNGKAAIEYLRANTADAVIIDDTLSDMSGRDLARIVKGISKSIVVVMYSSRLGSEENIPWLDSYLSKGRGPSALRTLLDTLMKA